MYDIIIIGAGVSGMTSALYSARSGKKVLILESDTIGGQIALSPRVENYPSIKQISGEELTSNLFEQITDLGVDFELEKVEKVEKVGKNFVVTTDYETRECKSVIIATGAKARKIGVDGEEDLVGHGVSYCAVCDGAFYEGEEVALIGDANTALQYGMLLSNSCKKVYVLTLFDRFFGEPGLVKALCNRDNVEVHHNLQLLQFKQEDGELTGLVFKNTQDGSIFDVNVKGVFIAVGQAPQNEIFKNLVDLDKNGYIIADENCTTKVDGLFVAGDTRTKSTRQLTTAVADGSTCGLAACRYIDQAELGA